MLTETGNSTGKLLFPRAEGFPLFCITSISLLAAICGLLIAFIAVLGGCSHSPAPIVTPSAPAYHIKPEVWRAIDGQIYAATVYAKHESSAYARITMEEWRRLVRRHIEDVFIPWYSSYWTQQWIATKVSWYQLQYVEGEATPEDRLVDYLQEQFYAQVLEPVSSLVDPRIVMEDTTGSYLRELKARLTPLPSEYQIPVDAFNKHLDAIPAIAVQAPPLQTASLHEVLQTPDLFALPAYTTLLSKIMAVNETSGQRSSSDRLHSIARTTVTKLVGTMAIRGSATAASTLIGGFWGVLITMGSTAWSVAEHEHDKPEMVLQLQENLNAALGVMWQDLVEDPQYGVTAAVNHISEQIEHAVFHPPQTAPPKSTVKPTELF